jgi:hypothetical protein
VVVGGSLESHVVEVVGEGRRVPGSCRGRATGGLARVGVRPKESTARVALGIPRARGKAA